MRPARETRSHLAAGLNVFLAESRTRRCRALDLSIDVCPTPPFLLTGRSPAVWRFCLWLHFFAARVCRANPSFSAPLTLSSLIRLVSDLRVARRSGDGVATARGMGLLMASVACRARKRDAKMPGGACAVVHDVQPERAFPTELRRWAR